MTDEEITAVNIMMLVLLGFAWYYGWIIAGCIAGAVLVLNQKGA